MLCLSRILFQFVELPVRVTFVPFYVTVQLLLVVPVYLLCQTFFFISSSHFKCSCLVLLAGCTWIGAVISIYWR